MRSVVQSVRSDFSMGDPFNLTDPLNYLLPIGMVLIATNFTDRYQW